MGGRRNYKLDTQSTFELLEEEIGTEAVTILCHLRGGGSVYFPPERLTDDHWLVEALGRELAERACAVVGGRFELPKGVDLTRRTRLPEVLRLSQDGLTAIAIGRQLDLHSRTVYRYRRSIAAKLLRIHGKAAAALSARGLGVEEIAAELHQHPWNVRLLLRALGDTSGRLKRNTRPEVR